MARINRLLFAAGIAVGALAPVTAADEMPPATAVEHPQLNRAAYSALQGDEELADLNIGVRVLHDGTALLWGTATPAEVAKAEALLKTLKGITKVVSTCDAVGAPDPLVARVEAGVRTAPAADSTRPTPPKREVVKSDPPAAAPPPLAAGAPVSRHTTTVEKPRVARAQSPEPAARLLDPAAVRPPMNYAAVDQVRRGDPKFARLTFDLRDGRVVIGGHAADPAVAWELARKIAPLVGDRDIVVGVGRR